MIRYAAFLLIAGSALLLCACGSSMHDCTPTPLVVTISPASATADHSAVAPANQAQFTYSTTGGDLPNGCSVAAIVEPPQWSSSDPTNITFADTTDGLATCTGATSGAATVSVKAFRNGTSGKGTASLTCN